MRLPLPPNLDLDLDTLIYILRAALIIHAQLEEIAVLELAGAALLVGRAEAHMVEERAGGALGVPDEELAARLDPDLGVRPADDLALERELVRPEGVGRREPEPRAVGEPPDAQGCLALAHVPADGVEPQRPPRLEMGHEADAVGLAERR